MQFLAPISPDHALDTAIMVTSWEFTRPDLLTIATTDGLVGYSMDFRVRGDSMVGMLQAGGDVIMVRADTSSDPIERVTGRRVPC